MKPEKMTELKLFGWLRPKVKEIYMQEKNIMGAPCFKVKSKLRRVPDMILKTKWGKYIAIEIKPTSKGNSKVQEGAAQLFEDQYKNYVEGNLHFEIGEELIEIDCFLLATDSSLESSIFKLENKDLLIDNSLDEDPHKRACVLKYKTMPRFEYSRTHDLIRNIFKTHKQYFRRNKNKVLVESGIGILIADFNNNDPHMYVKHKTNKRWGQHYWRI